MFWICVLVLMLFWMLVKLGAMSATVGFLGLGLKLLLLLLAIITIASIAIWLRRKR